MVQEHPGLHGTWEYKPEGTEESEVHEFNDCPQLALLTLQFVGNIGMQGGSWYFKCLPPFSTIEGKRAFNQGFDTLGLPSIPCRVVYLSHVWISQSPTLWEVDITWRADNLTRHRSSITHRVRALDQNLPPGSITCQGIYQV